MKKILKITAIIYFLCISQLSAQKIKSGDYIPNPINKKFEGTWFLSTKHAELIIVFKNIEKIKPKFLNSYIDQIQGSLTLIKDGKTIENPKAITGFGEYKNSFYILNASFSDIDDFSGARLVFTFPRKNNFNKLQVTATPFNYDGLKVNVKDLRIPKTFTLKRVK
jgi:hypothetical protein